MCTRNALVLRLDMVYEENMIERRQRQAEEKKTKDAAKSAALIAQKYLETDEGMMYVRDEAERRIATSSKVSKALPAQNVSSRSSFASIASMFRRESFKTQRKRIEAEIRREYIDQEVETKVISVKQENAYVKRFAKKWVGNTVEDIFDGWRKLVRLSSKQRRQKARARLREERRIYENDIAAYDMKNLHLTKYDEMYDQYNDLPVWVHRDSKETLYDKPTNTLEYPEIPRSLVDDNGEPLTPRTIARLEASSSSDDDDEYSSAPSHNDATDRVKDDDSDSTSSLHVLRGLDAEVELAKQRVLEKRRSKIVEVAAKSSSNSNKIATT